MELSTRNDRLKAATGAALLQGLIGYALISGLGVALPQAVGDSLKLFDVAPERPPPPIEEIEPHPVQSEKPEGAAAPPNLVSKATVIVAPPPIVPPILLNPVVAAPIPSIGRDATSGAADMPGPGTGAGGVGNGTGSGRFGDGGGRGGRETPPRQIGGRIRDSDYPQAAEEAGAGGRVAVRFTVATNGRATDCSIDESSGSAALDETTCRLIEERFRFRPSRDAQGRPVPSTVLQNHVWVFELIPEPPPAAR